MRRGDCTAERVNVRWERAQKGRLLDERQVEGDVVVGRPAEVLRRAVRDRDGEVVVARGRHGARIDEGVLRGHGAVWVTAAESPVRRTDGTVDEAVVSVRDEGRAGAAMVVFLMGAHLQALSGCLLKGFWDPNPNPMLQESRKDSGVAFGSFVPLAAETISAWCVDW